MSKIKKILQRPLDIFVFFFSFLLSDEDFSIFHSISNRKFCCFSCIIAMVHQNSPTVEFWQEKIEGHLRGANTEPSVDFRRANTEPSVDFRRANTDTY